ncbi:UDP-N-acetylglucosamine 2-epimerase (non-hydrolyzing) [uncultured Sulfitobacter sp.]|uniref:non-hydrolyzing UDP-N-acetylglucosamine 2-epimerase n=1 Tax=uncultured Sulfitobacter sp. TaxID=191468 RepID=UPI0032B12CF7
MKLLTVIGARPQFIKAATVSRVIKSRDDITEILVHTGQHYDANMSDIFFDEMQIPRPDHHLGIGGGTHGAMTGRQLEAIEQVLLDEKPDCVLVYGDTNSTLAGALAAVKLHVPVAHVEAGLRSFNRRMPEEINRILTDHASDLLFAPTKTAMRNLAKEGIPTDRTHLVGDVMYDACLFYSDRARKPEWFDTLGVEPLDFVLATVHRAENTDNPTRLAGILRGLAGAKRPVIFPVHPRTRQKIDALALAEQLGLHLVPPVGYLEMIWLEQNCAVVATDSGGVQKEAYFHGKPCVTLRDETEWVELVEAGVNVLAGTDAESVASALAIHGSPRGTADLFGDGQSASAIVSRLMALQSRPQ